MSNNLGPFDPFFSRSSSYSVCFLRAARNRLLPLASNEADGAFRSLLLHLYVVRKYVNIYNMFEVT